MNNDTQSSASEKDAAVAVSCGSPSDKAEYLEVEEPQSQEQSNSTCTSETGGLHKCIQNKKIVSKVRPPAHSKSRVMGYRLMPAVVPQSFLVPVHGHGYVPHRDHSEELSSTNLYIRGLAETCRDDDLVELCRQFGKIVSTKAILDKETNLCKGYGFVDFQHATDAQRAVVALSSNGVLAQFAKQQEQDPTNLYMSNLPQDYNEKNIEAMLQTYGNIVSTRVLRDVNGISRGVGFARLDSSESCEKAIMALNGTQLPGANEPLTVKFADGGASRRRASNPGRWKDLVTYSAPECFEMPQVLPNGYYNSRGLVQQYLPSGTHGYQMQQTWPPQYFNVPHGNSSLSLATTAPHAGVTSALPQQQSHYASSATTHTAHYTTQPAGWTISPTTQYIQQHS